MVGLSCWAPQVHSENSLCVVVYDAQNGQIVQAKGPDFNFEPTQSDSLVPLGSLWKLFVSAYIIENKLNLPPFRCEGKQSEELFCCKKGESIDFDQALAKSCGLYFSPERLGINKTSWRSFWRNQVEVSEDWIGNLEKMQPGTKVSRNELMKELAKIPDHFREFPELQRKLLGVVVNGTAADSIRYLGTSFRVKTYTWRDEPSLPFSGGFAGWLQNGNVVFAEGTGSGGKLIKSFAGVLEKLALENLTASKSSACVRVKYFEQYPISTIISEDRKQQIQGAATLQGRFTIYFKNGSQIHFNNSSSHLKVDSNRKIIGDYTFEDYIARVLQREVSAQPVEATKAFAVAARTYVLQNASASKDCYEVPDSTHFQRVAIGDLDSRFLNLARWSEGLILTGKSNLRYHSTSSVKGQLSWTRAKELAEAGLYFDQILLDAYAAIKFDLFTHQHYEPCLPLTGALEFLDTKQTQWQSYLKRKVGYSHLAKVNVCKTNLKNPYSNYSRGLIFLPQFKTEEDQISLAHEFVHLSFQNHPLSRDEGFVEETARSLLITPEVIK